MAPELWLALGALLLIGGVPLLALRLRGRQYATFSAVVLLFSLPAATALHALLRVDFPSISGWITAGFALALVSCGIHLGSLLRARLRAPWFRYGVSLPGMAFLALGAVSLPTVVVIVVVRGALWLAGLGEASSFLRWLDWLPVATVVAGLATSLRLAEEVVRIRIAEACSDEPDQVERVPVERFRRRRTPTPLPDRPLRIVQITDPHLGPFQPIHWLRRRIERLLEHDPDLVLLTGDFLTMESNATPGALADALSPLRGVQGRCFAIFGNHDHEAPEEVRSALESAGVELLIDEEVLTETPIGPVQIVGADHYFKERDERVQGLLERFPRRDDHLRLLLVHDPLRFCAVPRGEVDLALSGHTHGGQVGLVSFGFDWTVLSRSRWPDHGLFGHGRSRLYVHRGTGFYGFPLRIGVPGEASLLELVTIGPA